MSCSSCKYINSNNKKEGIVSGSCYYCSKLHSYVNGSNCNCELYDESNINPYICNRIYNDGKVFSNDNKPIELYIFIFVILIIVAIFVNL